MLEKQLQQYLDLNLTPIPLKGKKPLVKWKSWHPKTIDQLKPYIRGNVNWAVRTGGSLAVLDFDSRDAYVDFVSKNIDLLLHDFPVVETGRGYHLWFKPTQPLRSHAFDGVDLKAEGGYVVVPPSIHPGTGRRYSWHRPLGETIPELDWERLDLSGIAEKACVSSPSKPAAPHDEWELEDGLDTSDFDNGVPEGRRHNTLVRLIGWLVASKTPIDEIIRKANSWNAKNRPPLPQSELSATLSSCLTSFVSRQVAMDAKRRVQAGTAPAPKPIPTPQDDWELEFSVYDEMKIGSPKGNRHNTLVAYVRELLMKETDPVDIFTHLHDWNKKNQPPLSDEELYESTAACLAAFLNGPVPVVTYSPSLNVTTATEEQSKQNHYRDPKTGKCRPSFRIVQGKDNAHVYWSMPIYCGRWDCPFCANRFKNDWIDHIVDVTEGCDLHVLEMRKDEWPCARRAFGKDRADLNYVKITNGDRLTVILSGPFPGAKPLPRKGLVKFLRKTIPDGCKHRPISTSRPWQRKPIEPRATLVTKTALPLSHQYDVAKQLGAEVNETTRMIAGYGRWVSPDNEDPKVFSERLAQAIKIREMEVKLAIIKKPEKVRAIWEGTMPLEEYYREMGRGMTPSTT